MVVEETTSVPNPVSIKLKEKDRRGSFYSAGVGVGSCGSGNEVLSDDQPNKNKELERRFFGDGSPSPQILCVELKRKCWGVTGKGIL